MSIAVRVFGAVALTIIMGVAVALSVAGASGFRAMSFVAVFPIIILAVCAIINWSERP